MANGLNIDIGISKEEIVRMAKDVIREQVASQINEAMQAIDLKGIIDKKIEGIDDRILKLAEKEVKLMGDKLFREKEKVFKQVAHSAILEELSKKPLSGNVYLSLVAASGRTDYGSDDWE